MITKIIGFIQDNGPTLFNNIYNNVLSYKLTFMKNQFYGINLAPRFESGGFKN